MEETWTKTVDNIKLISGRAMAQAVSRRAEVRVNPCGICGGQSGTGAGFSPTSSVFPCQHNSTLALYSHITWGMNNRPVGGRSSEIQSHPIDMNKKSIFST
jgi:hypothetical protein